jgi:hypothetical protein
VVSLISVRAGQDVAGDVSTARVQHAGLVPAGGVKMALTTFNNALIYTMDKIRRTGENRSSNAFVYVRRKDVSGNYAIHLLNSTFDAESKVKWD